MAMAGKDIPGMAGRVSVMQPRLDEKPWGGRNLARFGLELPAEVPIGEALVTANDAEVAAGAGQGRTLGEIVAADPDVLGTAAATAVHGRSIFPLLVKLIDARENLSIQVHPNDAQAAPLDRLGKTEAWHVLAADPGACIYAGLRDGVSLDRFRRAAERLDGSSAPLLRQIEARPGATMLLPAGTVHALGAGVMVYEIQQPSDVTYRLDDWGRVDSDGKPREMHLDAGFAVADPELRPEWLATGVTGTQESCRQRLVTTRHFALEQIALAPGDRVRLPRISGPQVVTMLVGEGDVGDHALATGQSAVVWPGGDPVSLASRSASTALRAWVPDHA